MWKPIQHFGFARHPVPLDLLTRVPPHALAKQEYKKLAPVLFRCDSYSTFTELLMETVSDDNDGGDADAGGAGGDGGGGAADDPFLDDRCSDADDDDDAPGGGGIDGGTKSFQNSPHVNQECRAILVTQTCALYVVFILEPWSLPDTIRIMLASLHRPSGRAGNC